VRQERTARAATSAARQAPPGAKPNRDDTPPALGPGGALSGAPSQAAQAFELGYDAVLLNTAIARAGDPIAMARAFAAACEAGRGAFLAQPIEPRDMAAPSTPVIGLAFS
jgi:hypothetical protein